MKIILNPEYTDFKTILTLAKKSDRLVHGHQTPWWKVGELAYRHPKTRIPCGPRGEVIVETSNVPSFIKNALEAPDNFGENGLKAFVAAYHGNVILEDGRPTALDNWDEYNELINKGELIR